MSDTKENQLVESNSDNILTSEIEDKYTGRLTRSLYRLKNSIEQNIKRNAPIAKQDNISKDRLDEFIWQNESILAELYCKISESKKIISELQSNTKEISKNSKNRTPQRALK